MTRTPTNPHNFGAKERLSSKRIWRGAGGLPVSNVRQNAMFSNSKLVKTQRKRNGYWIRWSRLVRTQGRRTCT